MPVDWDRKDEPARIEASRRKLIELAGVGAILILAGWIAYLHAVAIPATEKRAAEAAKAATLADGRAGDALQQTEQLRNEAKVTAAQLRDEAKVAAAANDVALQRLHAIVSLESYGAKVALRNHNGRPGRVVKLRDVHQPLQEVLPLLRDIDDLEQLDLSGTQPVWLSSLLLGLSQMPRLGVLRVTSVSVEDAALASLKSDQLPGLRELDLSYSKVDGPNAPHLAGLTGLHKLSLSNLKGATPEGLKEVSSLSNLRELDLSDLRGPDPTKPTDLVTPEVIRSLGKLKNLEILVLKGSLSSPAELDVLGELQSLQTLDLSECSKIQGRWLKWLIKPSPLKSLHVLNLTNTPVQAADLEPLQDLPGLDKLSISVQGLTDADAAKLKRLKGLVELSILASPALTEAGLQELGKLNQLTLLSLAGSTAVTDERLKYLADLQNLRELDLSNTKINGSGFDHLAKIKSLQKLILPPRTATDQPAREKLNKALPNLVISPRT